MLIANQTATIAARLMPACMSGGLRRNDLSQRLRVAGFGNRRDHAERRLRAPPVLRRFLPPVFMVVTIQYASTKSRKPARDGAGTIYTQQPQRTASGDQTMNQLHQFACAALALTALTTSA